MPSDRLTRTDSSPSESTSTVSSVCTPSKSVTTASTSIARPSHGARASGAIARASSSCVDRVDLDGRGLVDLDDADAAEEAVTGIAEAGGIHHVEGARLEEVRLAVLPPRAQRLVVVDALGAAGRVALPQEAVRLDRREHACRTDRRRRGGCRHPARAGSMNGEVACRNTSTPTSDALRGERVEHVQQRALGARGVARELGRPLHDLRAPLLRDGGDLVVVGRDDDAIDELGRRARRRRRGRRAARRRPAAGSCAGRPSSRPAPG